MSNIHPTAIIEDGANIAKSAKVGAYTFIDKGVVLDENVEVFQGAQIWGNTKVGSDTKIYSHAVIGQVPQDLKFHGENVELIIGKNNTIREFAFFNPGTENDKGYTKIGDNNLFMAYTHVAHDVVVGDNNIFANNVALAGHVEVGNYVVIGGHTPVHQFCKIGDYAMIGGASALTQDIPPFCLAEGNRANIKSLNLVGIRRKLPKDDVEAILSAYKQLFRGQKPLKESAKELLEQSSNEKVKMLCSFILDTQRGIPYERNIKNDK
ncbi:MAG: acyl-[acyl-carrier-protein]--UDP-N-acetylglucosamine O-acyltransferase [Sulfurospirillum sp.]|nr:MAG: acyl-[acyl-carrier-protein]--UDP-N-acetylglucosamine O-acyltransferase [Sulfurospirillum sp.]